uniref:NADH-ubiquinone oxidoreductase chain 2 n=1 Tax=Trissolcus basalis TaxID=32421 RepID=I3PFL2_9HYME|nr:NADH dehydrogenase subunit 2 [Trissolcus basalis]
MIFLLNILSITINNWLFMWMLMEFNLMIFIPILIEKKNIKILSKISFKYFLIQSFASMIFLFNILMIFLLNNLINMNLIMIMLMITMFMKLGMSPFHMWFITMMNNLSWNNCFILSTIQKMIPFIIMMNMINKNLMIFLMFNIFNSIISTIGGLNQNFIKPLMAYSSINHMSWMMIINLSIEKIFYFYLFIYFIMNLMIMKFFEWMNIKFMNLIFSKKTSVMNKMIMFISILSLGGIPPTIGFLIKWSSIYSMKINPMMNFNLIILLMMSTITMIYYLNLIIPSLMYFNFENKIQLNKFLKKNFKFYIIMILYLTFSTITLNNVIY